MINKILLVIPNFTWGSNISEKGYTLWHYIPYNLCLLAAVLDQVGKYEVKVFDMFKNGDGIEKFKDIIRSEKPDFVGISVLMDFYGKSAHESIKAVKDVNKDIITCIGGVYATTNPEKVAADRNCNYVICGEGEVALPDLIDYLNGARSDLPKGVWYTDKNGVLFNGGHSSLITNLDDYPFPAYHHIDYLSYALSAERKSVDSPARFPYARILTSRGCPYNCCFCQVEKIAGRKFRPRSAANVLREIDWLVDTYGIKSLVFDDDNLLTDKARAIEIFEGLKKYNMPWKMIATAAFLLDDALISLMRDSGCIYVDIAIESGCDRVLREIINKPLQLETVCEVIKKLKQARIYVAANFIIGFPGETWDEIRKTIRFAELCDADYVKLFNAIPLPNTRLYKSAVEQNALIDGFDPENVNWSRGVIQTEEFGPLDLTILRAYEWDRINFSSPEKVKRTADMMGISVDEVNEIRRKNRRGIRL